MRHSQTSVELADNPPRFGFSPQTPQRPTADELNLIFALGSRRHAGHLRKALRIFMRQ